MSGGHHHALPLGRGPRVLFGHANWRFLSLLSLREYPAAHGLLPIPHAVRDVPDRRQRQRHGAIPCLASVLRRCRGAGFTSTEIAPRSCGPETPIPHIPQKDARGFQGLYDCANASIMSLSPASYQGALTLGRRRSNHETASASRAKSMLHGPGLADRLGQPYVGSTVFRRITSRPAPR